MARDLAQWRKHLLGKYKVLSSSPMPKQKQKHYVILSDLTKKIEMGNIELKTLFDIKEKYLLMCLKNWSNLSLI